MTTSVKQRIKIDLEQAKASNKQRVNRIGNILREAASMTFEEIKAGSTELNSNTKKTLAELLEEWRSVDDEWQENVNETAATIDAEKTSGQRANVLSWKLIVRDALAIVRDRRGDWFQAFKTHLHENAMQADHDLASEYGDRYTNVKNFFQRIVGQAEARGTAAATDQTSDSQPLVIEVVDGDAELPSTPVTVEVLEPEDNR
ncbi:MAG: hypothetical protein AAF892_17575 [Cyanobacteria bacterium P01_D01_bin.71]